VSIDVPSAYDAHVAFVWRLLLRLGVPTENVEDAVQEVFLVLHRRRAEFQQSSSLRTWLGGIAVRVASDQRRGQRRSLHHLAQLEQLPRLPPPEPSQALEEREAFALVQSLLAQLSQEQRTVFVLAEFEELTLREIADITGVNANTVSSRLRLARQRFEALVERRRSRERAS
jgi:RNA polymerase sigma-70 factor (ECF subfamily)